MHNSVLLAGFGSQDLALLWWGKVHLRARRICLDPPKLGAGAVKMVGCTRVEENCTDMSRAKDSPIDSQTTFFLSFFDPIEIHSL